MRLARVWFNKLGLIKHISHLDLQRCMIRAIQRAEIPVKYSEGFNPHPQISFASPLSLGVEGEREAMDIKLEGDIDNEALFLKLSEETPKGINIIEVTDPKHKFGDIKYAEYEILFYSKREERQALFEYIKLKMSGKEIKVIKKTKTKRIEINLADEILKYEIKMDENIALFVRLPSGSVNNINPALLLEGLKAEENTFEIEADIKRIALYVSETEKFQ